MCRCGAQVDANWTRGLVCRRAVGRIARHQWTSLPNDVVSAESTNIFKNRLDKFWANQDFKYDWNANISGIGSRSVNIV